MASNSVNYIENMSDMDELSDLGMSTCDVCQYLHPIEDLRVGYDKKRCASCYNSYIAAKEEYEYFQAHPEELARIIAIERKRKQRYEEHGIIENCEACLELPVGTLCPTCVICSSCGVKFSTLDHHSSEGITADPSICWRCTDAHYDEVCEAIERRYEDDRDNYDYNSQEEDIEENNEEYESESDNGGVLLCGCIDLCRCSPY